MPTLLPTIRRQPIFVLSLLVALVLLLSSCASPQAEIDELSEQGLYEQAQAILDSGGYARSVELFRQLEADYPFGNYAEAAQLSLIFAYYKSNEFELADATARRFIRLHPNHINVDYAYYLRGLAAFPEPASFFQSIFSADLSRKSIDDAEDSFLRFSELVERFPESLYIEDARQRMTYLRNLMARHELHVANQYMDYKTYNAAINRAQYVLQNFQKSTATPDALAVLVKSYRELGMHDQSDNHLALLKTNYPNYPAINNDGSFNFNFDRQKSRSIGRWLTFGLITNSKPPGFDTRNVYEQ